MFPLATLLPLIELLRSYVLGVMRPLGDRIRKAPAMWRPEGKLIPDPLCFLIHMWLQKRRQMIEALMRRIAAGTHIPRPYKPREPRPDATPKLRAEIPPETRLPPRKFGWINSMASEVTVYGNALSHLLSATEMKPMTLASPQMARLWLPLLNAMGQPKPDWWPKPPPRPRRPRPPRPRTKRPVMAAPYPAIASPAALPPPWYEHAGLRPPELTVSPQRPLGVWDNPWVRPSTRRFGEF